MKQAILNHVIYLRKLFGNDVVIHVNEGVIGAQFGRTIKEHKIFSRASFECDGIIYDKNDKEICKINP